MKIFAGMGWQGMTKCDGGKWYQGSQKPILDALNKPHCRGKQRHQTPRLSGFSTDYIFLPAKS